MALMFQRLARNFAKNGYFPTDEQTLERSLKALSPAGTKMRILDPCAGEGVAIAEAAHFLGREKTQACAVEYNHERADHARTLVDRALRSDLLDTVITRQSFGLLWLNPPYGDLTADHNGNSSYQGTGRKRLEKLFYQKTYQLLQYGGVLVFIIPSYTVDKEMAGWLCNHFADLRIYAAPEQQFRQVVIFGVRKRVNDRSSPDKLKADKDRLIAVGAGEVEAEVLPEEWPWESYVVPGVQKELEHFYRVSLEPEQFALEMTRLGGLWPEFQMHFSQQAVVPRQPARALSPWHLALSLAAGAISGVITSKTGKTLVVKGNTYKEKARKIEVSEDENGNIVETRIMIDKFVPVIKAWDMTPHSETFGCVLTITSNASTPSDSGPLFEPGRIVATVSVSGHVENGDLNPDAFLKRHLSGDWGDLSEEDVETNRQALQYGNRLFSSYKLDRTYESGYGGTDDKLWIITEADRSVTTLLFPSEY